MREIKFRAWDGMVMVNGMPLVLGRYINFPQIANTVWIPDMTEQDHEDGKHWTLMEFTGLKDKNGKDIFEGDVVHLTPVADRRAGNWEEWSINESKPIVFDGAAFRFDGMNLAEMMGWGGYPSHINCEIIGNIYENPDLI